MPARRAHQPPRRIRREPPLVLAPIPDAVLGPQHPAVPLAVEHRKVADRKPERPRLERPASTLGDQGLVAGLCFGEGIDGHVETVSPGDVEGVSTGPV